MYKKLLVTTCFVIIAANAFAGTLVNSYQDARSALNSGAHMTIVFDQSKCSGGQFPVVASVSPHATMMTSASILTSDTTLTNQDPYAAGKLVHEVMDYTLLPNGGKASGVTCNNVDGCMVLNSSVYDLTGNQIKAFPALTCHLGTAARLYFS